MTKVALGPRTLIYPAPALLIGANVDGKANFMTAAWGGVANSEPPMVCAGIRHERNTHRGIEQNRTFSVNIPSVDLVKETDYCGITPGSKVNKAAVCGFRVFYGKLKTAPMIEQCPVNLECEVAHILELGTHSLVVGRVVESLVLDTCLTNGEVDAAKVRPLVYGIGVGQYLALGEFIAQAHSVGKELRSREPKTGKS